MADPAPSERPADVGDEEEESQVGSQATTDYLDQILENYNFICHPETRLKFKQELGLYGLGICLAKPWNHSPRLRITMKPSANSGFLGKGLQKLLIVPTHAQICLFSKKIQFGWLRLQFMAGYNWKRNRSTLDYRITTKWSDGPRFKRKERYQVLGNMLVRCKWNMDINLPDLEGHLGQDGMGLDPIDVDFGRMDFEIQQLDFVLHSPLFSSSSSENKQLPGPATSHQESKLMPWVSRQHATHAGPASAGAAAPSSAAAAAASAAAAAASAVAGVAKGKGSNVTAAAQPQADANPLLLWWEQLFSGGADHKKQQQQQQQQQDSSANPGKK